MFGRLLIDIARKEILDHLQGNKSLDHEMLIREDERFSQEAATFVTLTLHGELRGCIGSIVPHRSLLDDLCSNAKAAAFHDPRFPPLTLDEFKQVTIEVSLLSLPKRFEYESILELKEYVTHQHGVILKQGYAQATFLPQVWEELPNFELFFSHLCQKAGLDTGCLNQNPEIYLYEVEKFKE